MLLYEGLFFESEEAEKIKKSELLHLKDIPGVIHVTFKFKPNSSEIFNELVGKYFEIYLVGYGNDGKNSGFAVELPDCLKKYYISFEEGSKKLRVPHITVSLATGAKAIDTKNLEFKPLNQRVKVTGRFGYWVKENGCEYLSFNSYVN